MASNDDIMRVLGRLEEKVEQLSEDVSEEKKDAHDSRASIHRRLDEQVSTIAFIDKTVGIEAQVNAQMRDQFAGLAKTVKENQDAVTPYVEDMKRLKTIGIGITGMIAIGGLSIGALVVWFSETSVNAVRHWLKIP
jgi:hypothetical protein